MQHGNYRPSPEKRAALRERARTGDLAVVVQCLVLARDALDTTSFRVCAEQCNLAANGLTDALDLHRGELGHVNENLEFVFGPSERSEVRESIQHTIRKLELGQDKASRESMSQTLVLLEVLSQGQ